MFDITKLLGKLSLAFRGHREYGDSENKGVFREFVEYVSETNPLLKDHLLNSPGKFSKIFYGCRCSYLSYFSCYKFMAL